MKPEAWAKLKTLQRANKPARVANGSYIDTRRQRSGMQPRFTDQDRSRKAMRRARVKGK